jgi:class 3 adenylate cyclase
VGIGLHVGLVVEGPLGGKVVKAADVIGDAVNIAKQIAANAGPGELLVSEAMRIAIGTTFRAGPKRQLATKDRDELIVVYPLE